MTPLDEALGEALRSSFPGVNFEADLGFRPMFSLSRGLLSSSVLLRVAQQEKIPTEDAAKILIGLLERRLPVQLTSARGYLICRDLPIGLLRHYSTRFIDGADLTCDGLKTTNQAVPQYCCMVPDSRIPAYARLRLVSRLVMLSYLSVSYGRPVRMLLHPFISKVVRNKQECLEVFSSVVGMILAQGGEATLEHNDCFDQDMFGEETKLILTSHAYYELLSEKSRAELNTARESGTMVVMPADGWLLSRDRSLSNLLSPESLQNYVHEIAKAGRWDMFLFHSAGTVSSGDFDPAVALFDECASPLWSLRLLVERFNRVFTGWQIPENVSCALSENHRITTQDAEGLRGVFMGRYIDLALKFGVIDDFMEILEAFVRCGHRLVNTPHIRSLERSMEDCTEQERYLLTGLGCGLSTILPLAMEDSCAAHS
jgi:hypothetical protein